MAKNPKINSPVSVLNSSDDSAIVETAPIVTFAEMLNDAITDVYDNAPITLDDLDAWIRGTVSQWGLCLTDWILAFVDSYASVENPEIRALKIDIDRSSATFRTGTYTGMPVDLSRRYAMRKICLAQWGSVVRVPTLNVTSTATAHGYASADSLPTGAKFQIGFRPGMIMASDVFNEANAAATSYLRAFDAPKGSADSLPTWNPIESGYPADGLRLATWGTKAPNPYVGPTPSGKAPFKPLTLGREIGEYAEKERKVNEISELRAECEAYRATIRDLESQIALLRQQLANV